MPSSPVIQVENLSKYYRLGLIGGGTLNEDINRWIAKMRGKPDSLLEAGEKDHANRKGGQIWALRDVSLEVNEGEILGIIGRNGAGKSTLLKILSKITAPTEGRIKIRGRVGSLLEVGTGFHPELTGRENIFLNGTILGMSHSEVKSKFEEIVEFAEMGKFIDTPVKRYSSGMRVRLAFAVAAHLEPEILVIDEVLAVGDAVFQKKCLGKMKDVAGHGRTILFVSHNMTSIKSLCTSAYMLEKGAEYISGDVGEVVNKYLSAASTEVYTQEWEDPEGAPGDNGVRVRMISVKSVSGKPATFLQTNSDLLVEIEFCNLGISRNLMVALNFMTSMGVVVFTTSMAHHRDMVDRVLSTGTFRAKCIIPKNFLNDERYIIRLLFIEDGRRVLFKMDEALTITVHDTEKRFRANMNKRPGVVAPTLKWSINQIDA